MRGIWILIVFFSMFTVASLLIPSPMFPGIFFSSLIGQSTGQNAEYLSAIFNGVFYGVILWLVFILLSRRLEAEK